MTTHFHPKPPQQAPVTAVLTNLLLLGTSVAGDSEITGLLLIGCIS
jgi:hypothetical protein